MTALAQPRKENRPARNKGARRWPLTTDLPPQFDDLPDYGLLFANLDQRSILANLPPERRATAEKASVLLLIGLGAYIAGLHYAVRSISLRSSQVLINARKNAIEELPRSFLSDGFRPYRNM
jgi:hypothetical protein